MTGSSSWLIVGHGSVGSFVAERVSSQGAAVAVLDASPRVPIDPKHRSVAVGEMRDADYAVSCVGHDSAAQIPALVEGALASDAILFDWNSASPTIKLQVRDAASVAVIDVALVDSLDAPSQRPNLAVSGQDVEAAAEVLRTYGFNAEVVGDEVGQAARVKFLRSIFMKGLEGLMLEYSALAVALDPRGVVRRSLEPNLGSQCLKFLDLLVSTDRIHAERRTSELEDAVRMMEAEDFNLTVAPAAAETLRRAAIAWNKPEAPAPEAGVAELAAYLRRIL